VVLGCRVGPGGVPSGPLKRRCERAARAFRDGLSTRVLVCGGKAWYGHREGEVMLRELTMLGVPAAAVVCELQSRTTWGNALHGARHLRELGARRIALVTCDFHQRRALAAFRRFGLDAVGLPCLTPGGLRQRFGLDLREALFTALQPGASWRP
jgi:uncharacterized SAM-binding protein YcdF (DUF218 family)